MSYTRRRGKVEDYAPGGEDYEYDKARQFALDYPKEATPEETHGMRDVEIETCEDEPK